MWGELSSNAARRILLEDTGLKANLKFIGMFHKVDINKSKEVLEDTLFYIYKGINIQGKLKEDIREGKNIWMKLSGINLLEYKFDRMLELINKINSEHEFFQEEIINILKY